MTAFIIVIVAYCVLRFLWVRAALRWRTRTVVRAAMEERREIRAERFKP